VKIAEDRQSMRLKDLPGEAERRAYLEALEIDVWALRGSVVDDNPDTAEDTP